MSVQIADITRERRSVAVDIVVGDGEQKRAEKCVFTFLTVTPKRYDELLKRDENAPDQIAIARQLVGLDLRSNDVIDADGKPADLRLDVLSSWDLFNLLNLQNAVLGEIFPKNVQSSPTSDAGS